VEILGHTIYTVSPNEFVNLVQKRIRDLEATLLQKVIELTETESARGLAASVAQPSGEVSQAYEDALQNIRDAIVELRTRIDAIRGLTSEFNEVKHD